MPIHYAMGNCERSDSPQAVEMLLEKEPELANIDFDHKQHPLYVLANRTNKLKDADKRKEGLENALKSMNIYLSMSPKPTTNFFCIAAHTSEISLGQGSSPSKSPRATQ
mmetsp:Transcript_21027/g.30814  ORF Transcript_21027/g.30814 Transcript_21027/m.30814 type:complete len:109 (+) Transcript_21027:160-486(+)